MSLEAPRNHLSTWVKLDLVKKTSGWSGSPAILFLDRLAKNANQTRSEFDAVSKR